MPRQYGFIVDRDRCVDCRACVTACKAANDVELGISWRRVTTTWNGSYPDVTFASVSTACHHCAQPACVEVCPAGAISKRAEDGIVVVDRSRCIGCRSCEGACPYDGPQYGKDGTMQKCDLCLSRIAVGREPSCVATCAAGALLFGSMDELPGLVGKTVVPLEGPTRPSILVPAPGA